MHCRLTMDRRTAEVELFKLKFAIAVLVCTANFLDGGDG